MLDIEAELRRLQLWDSHPPDEEALASLVPFCHDTLRLEQWLQWLMLPRMKTILEADAPLPASSEIAPLAALRLEQLGVEDGKLLALIEAFDYFINQNH